MTLARVGSVTRAGIGPLLVCVFVVAVCFPHLSGKLLLIGNSDRLNSFLNIRMFETQALLKFGRIPLWNDRMFGGFDLTSLPYMIPILHPIARVLALAPESIVYVLGLWAILSYLLVGLAAYPLLMDLTRDRFLAAVGAIIYLSGYQVYFRAFQVDDAVINYAMLPLAILMVRRLSVQFTIRHFIGLFVCIVLVMLSFLQESSYVLLLIGLYTLFAAWQRRSWNVILFSGAAIASAIVFAFPRVLDIYLDLKNYTRGSAAGLNAKWEFFRLFYDGLFGRNFEEAERYTKVHVHEGYATYTSVFAPLVLVTLGFLSPSRFDRTLLLIVVAFLDSVFVSLMPLPTCVHLAVFVFALSVLFGKSAEQIDAHAPSPADDLSFYLCSFVACTLCILNPMLRTAVYHLFFDMDFTHSRLSVLVIFAVAMCVPVLLARFVRRYRAPSTAEPSALEAVVLKPPYWFLIFIVASALCDSAAQAISWRLLGIIPIPVQLGSMTVIEQALIYLVVMIAIFVAINIAFLVLRHRFPMAAQIYALALCGVLVASGARYTYFELFGHPNRSFPIAFQNHNMFDAPPDVFRMPQGEALGRVHEKLDSDNYRTAFLFDPALYRGELNFQSYLAQFWQLRVVDGYVPAVPTRLMEFPWPSSVIGLRTIRFAKQDDLSWPVLAMLNVKSAIAVDNNFFFNVKSEVDYSAFDASQLQVVTNPLHVTPRFFFAKNVAPLVVSSDHQELLSNCSDDAAPGTLAEDGKPYPDKAMVSTHGIPLPVDPRTCSIVNGFGQARRFSTDGMLAVEFQQDRIIARMTPSSEDRFLVLNERGVSSWQAQANGQELKVWETNLAMRGVVVPKQTAEIVFSYRPFVSTYAALAIVGIGLASALACAFVFSSLFGRGESRDDRTIA